MGDLTTNFSKVEFLCRCGKCEWNNPDSVSSYYLVDLANQLQLLRNYISKKEKRDVQIIAHCGIRCKDHNKNVGGEEYSRHLPGYYMKGQGAFDCHAAGMSNRKFRRYVKKAWKLKIIDGGCGLYSWGIHSDTSSRRFWGRFWGKP